MGGPLRLTAVPLQRAGALAIAHLAGVEAPRTVTENELDAVIERMTVDAVNAASARTTRGPAADPHAWWWGVLFGHFPNAREVHPKRHQRERDAEELGVGLDEARERWVREHRNAPAADPELGPCAFCGHDACRVVDKSSWPLLPRADLFNDVPPRTDPGTPVCRGCLAAGWAVPYASRRIGRLFVAFDSEDTDLLAELVGQHVDANLQLIAAAASSDLHGGYEDPAHIAYAALGRYPQPPRGDLRAVLYLNDAQEPEAEVRWLDTRRCRFAQRAQPSSPRFGRAVSALDARLTVRGRDGEVRTPGMRQVARRLLGDPEPHLLRAVRDTAAADLASAPAVLDLAIAYVEGVMDATTDTKRITDIGDRVALLISATEAKGDLRSFQESSRSPAALQRWLRQAQVEWLLAGDHDRPLVDDDDFLALFPAAHDTAEAWWRMNLLFTSVVAALFRRGWLQRQDAETLAEVRDAEDAPDDEEFEQ